MLSTIALQPVLVVTLRQDGTVQLWSFGRRLLRQLQLGSRVLLVACGYVFSTRLGDLAAVDFMKIASVLSSSVVVALLLF